MSNDLSQESPLDKYVAGPVQDYEPPAGSSLSSGLSQESPLDKYLAGPVQDYEPPVAAALVRRCVGLRQGYCRVELRVQLVLPNGLQVLNFDGFSAQAAPATETPRNALFERPFG